MKRIILLIIISLTLTLIIGCNKYIDEEIGIRGEITEISLNDSGEITNILVEGKIDEDTQYDKASVTIDEDTNVYKEEFKNLIKSDELKEGLKVEVVFSGPVKESYPVQGEVEYIRIIE